jgi:hypothetical protein
MTKFKTGNTAATKPADQKQTAMITWAVTQAEKAQLMQAAYPNTVASYLRRVALKTTTHAV